MSRPSSLRIIAGPVAMPIFARSLKRQLPLAARGDRDAAERSEVAAEIALVADVHPVTLPPSTTVLTLSPPMAFSTTFCASSTLTP